MARNPYQNKTHLSSFNEFIPRFDIPWKTAKVLQAPDFYKLETQQKIKKKL
jgi:hypothetical protein